VVLEESAVRGAVVDPPALGVDHGDQVADVFRDEPEALLAFLQLLHGAPVLGDVAEAPPPAYRLPFAQLRPGIALENSAVLEFDGVEALQPGMRVEVAHLRA